jgi:broad specificity phosphatase PhoE
MEQSFFVGRHFEDINDLTDGLDTKLKPLSEQPKEMVDRVVNEIFTNTLEKGLSRVLIVSSDKTRALETSEIIKDGLAEKDPSIKTRIVSDSRFAELDHGKPILPEGYVREARIDYLKDAWNSFWSETFDEDGNYKNYDYKFGDPLEVDGKPKYPMLVGRFLEFGESYRQLCLRYYEGVLEFLKNIDRIGDTELNIVLVAHSSTVAIINKMFEVARDGRIFSEDFKVGDLMKICWQYYQEELKKGTAEPNIAGQYKTISLKGLDIPRVASILEQEVDYLNEH